MAWFDPPLYKPGNRKCPKCGQPQAWKLLRASMVRTCSKCQSVLIPDYRRLAAIPIPLTAIAIASIAVAVLVHSDLLRFVGLLALLASSWLPLWWLLSWKLGGTGEATQVTSAPTRTEGVITISRDEGYTDSLRAYSIVLDGRVTGYIWQGQTVELNVPPGNHTLALRIDWGRSNIVRFDMGDGRIDFKCGSSLRGMRVYLTIVYMTLLFNRWIWLRQSP